MNQRVSEEFLLSLGYKKDGYGYSMESMDNKHWCTLFKDDRFQMYAYNKSDHEMEKVYDTGVIQSNTCTFINLIQCLYNNHH